MAKQGVTGVQEALKLEKVPAKKWPRLVLRTIIGIGFIVLACVGGGLWSWPWQPVLGVAVLGASVWSTQIVNSALLALVRPLRDLTRASDGEGGKDG